MPQSTVSLPRQRAVRDAVTEAAALLGIPTPKVVITPIRAVGRTRTEAPQSVQMDTYLAVHAPIPVVQALVAHEVGHLAPDRPSDQRSRLLDMLRKFFGIVSFVGLMWMNLTRRGEAHDLALLTVLSAIGLAIALLVASCWSVRPLERAADKAAVKLVGTEAFVAAQLWIVTHYHRSHQSRLWQWVKEAIDTHPPTAERIAMAQKMAAPSGPLLEALGPSATAKERRPGWYD